MDMMCREFERVTLLSSRVPALERAILAHAPKHDVESTACSSLVRTYLVGNVRTSATSRAYVSSERASLGACTGLR